MSAPIKVRLTAYFAAVFAKGTRRLDVDFDRLARSFDCTRRTVEMAVRAIRQTDRFIFKTVRAGRSYLVQVSDRNPCIKGVFLLTKKKEIQYNTARPAAPDLKKSSSWVSKPAPRPIQALAGWLARNVLAREHRAASRTMFRFGHAFNFAVDALHAGHAKADLIDAWRYALRNVDADLANLPPAIRWEPSSLVSLARRRLADGLTAAARVGNRRRALNAPKIAAPAACDEPPVKSMADFAAEIDALAARMGLAT